MTPDSSRYWPKDQYTPGRAATQLRQAVRPRLPRADRLEQAAAGPVAARRRRGADARKVPRSVSPPHRDRISSDAAAGTARTTGRRNGDQGRPLRGRAAGVREALHRPRPAKMPTAIWARPRTCSGMHRNTLSRKITEYRLRRDRLTVLDSSIPATTTISS